MNRCMISLDVNFCNKPFQYWLIWMHVSAYGNLVSLLQWCFRLVQNLDFSSSLCLCAHAIIIPVFLLKWLIIINNNNVSAVQKTQLIKIIFKYIFQLLKLVGKLKPCVLHIYRDCAVDWVTSVTFGYDMM